MTIYIDQEYRCHVTNPDGLYREVDVPYAFDGKCETFIEGYRYIPSGESWTNEDGEVFDGKMRAPWRKYEELAAAQAEYERNRAEIERLQAETEEANAVLNELIGGVNDVQYE